MIKPERTRITTSEGTLTCSFAMLIAIASDGGELYAASYDLNSNVFLQRSAMVAWRGVDLRLLITVGEASGSVAAIAEADFRAIAGPAGNERS
jgi:hypothetical protein